MDRDAVEKIISGWYGGVVQEWLLDEIEEVVDGKVRHSDDSNDELADVSGRA